MNTITDRDIRRAAVVMAAGYSVNTIKLQCSPRCAFEYPDVQAVRQLLDDYELRKILPIPSKSVFQAHALLLSRCKDFQSGRIGGGI